MTSCTTDHEHDAYVRSFHVQDPDRSSFSLSLINACWEVRWLVQAMGLKLVLLTSYDSDSGSGDGPPSLMDVDEEETEVILQAIEGRAVSDSE